MEATATIVKAPDPSRIVLEQESRSPGGVETSGERLGTKHPWGRRAWRAFVSALDWVFGFLAVVVALALLSVIPILNLLSLGYLLEASGRVAESGRWRDGFVGIRRASVLGSLVIGTWLVSLPVRFVSGLWSDAQLVAPGSATADNWKIALIFLTLLTFFHIAWACLRGGRLRHFLWPAPVRLIRSLRRPDLDSLLGIGDRVGAWFQSLDLPRFFWLGFKGFVGAVMWLAIPVGILVVAAQVPVAGVAAMVNLLGVALLTGVVLYLPFLQAHFARSGKFEALFQVGEVRQIFRRAPIAFWFALFITLLFALPLYLLKIELTPKEVAWLPALLFVAFIFPARLLTGWSLGRGIHREQPRNWCFRWLGRLAAIPVVLAYVIFVWMTQYLSWNGSLSLLEQHAFLVPAPLLGL